MGRRVRTVKRCAAYLHLLSCLAFGLCSIGLAYAHDGSQSKEQKAALGDPAAAIVPGELKDNDIIVNEDKGEGGLDSPGEKGRVDFTFVHAFVASLSVIIVSELGDKTFFIAAIMAMRHPRITIFAGALGALAVMTVLSALLGYAITIIPRKFTYYASTVLFFIFGIRMLREGWGMSPDEGQEELEEVQAELKRRDEENSLSQGTKSQPNHIENHVDGDIDEREKEMKSSMTQDPESGIIRGGYRRRVLGIFSPILLEAFTLTFLAEWGDRSQMTTIVLAARENVLGVTLGGTLGHAFCTGLAVIGGRMIAQRISARTVTLTGGVVFLVFALSALFFSPDDS
ncbi:transmembrane protein 165-like isoform X1 [Lytechinus variegatus]|uniref:transmembrane protein 165-like isoform X1 n=1 Tax=Lytechinus variegatus TaxID=7654 RepID=UPI001BB152E8|nr:transmembrane protein 165-like isoform X1 [Lytechinus variegatus]